MRQLYIAMREEDRVRYEEGVRLFNSGAFWHAHEQWEDCWKHAAEPDATFYKGIIQTAAALVHWQRGNPRGLQRNWAKARPKLAGLPASMHGLDLAAVIAAMDHFVLDHAEGIPAPLVQHAPLDDAPLA